MFGQVYPGKHWSNRLKECSFSITHETYHQKKNACAFQALTCALSTSNPHSSGAGNAVLHLPLAAVNLAIGLPLCVHICSPLGRQGSLDLRLNLLSIGASWDVFPNTQYGCRQGGLNADHRRFQRRGKTLAVYRVDNPYSLQDVVQSTASLGLACLMLPDHVRPGIQMLSRFSVQAHALLIAHHWCKRKWSRQKDTALQHNDTSRSSEASYTLEPAHHVSCCLQVYPEVYPEASYTLEPAHHVSCCLQKEDKDCHEVQKASSLPMLSIKGRILQWATCLALQLSASSLLLVKGCEVWSYLHPTSHHMASALLALTAVMLDCRQLQRQAANGVISKGPQLEAAWRAVHKRSAKRVAKYLGDLPASPPLAPTVRVLKDISIRAGVASADGGALLSMLTSESLCCGGNLNRTSAAVSIQVGPKRRHQASPVVPCTTDVDAACVTTQLSTEITNVQRHSSVGYCEVVDNQDGGLDARNLRGAHYSSREPVLACGTNLSQESSLCSSHHTSPPGLEVSLSGTEGPSTCVTSRQIIQASSHTLPGKGGQALMSSQPDVRAPCLMSTPAHDCCTSCGSSNIDRLDGVVVPSPAVASLYCQGGADTGISLVQEGPLCTKGSHVTISAGQDKEGTERVNISGADSSFLVPASFSSQREHYVQCTAATSPQERVTATAPSSHANASSSGSSGVQKGQTAEDTHCSLAPFICQPVGSFLEAAITAGLPLYGRHDHSILTCDLGSQQQTEAMTLSGILILGMRALLLVLAFLPFLLIGIPLLFLSAYLIDQEEDVSSYKTSCRQRARVMAWNLLLFGCRTTGAAFIKWGQWAATRTDIFPPDFCDIMSTLHENSPVHSFEYTKRSVEAALGVDLATAFISFESKPLASASIAQVHRAMIQVQGSEKLLPVAVKVCHPHVQQRITLDFVLLKALAKAVSSTPLLRGLGLEDSVSQFSSTMTAQCDLRVEAAHLERFYNNFKGVESQVTTPRPLWASRGVLIETFEQGSSVSHFIKRRTPYNTEIVALGVDTYLSMLLKHNFVHTDLHPGNIMVRVVGSEEQVICHDILGSDAENDVRKGIAKNQSSAYAICLDTPASGVSSATGPGMYTRTQLVLLDFGLAEELTPRVRHHFISFLTAICAGHGARAARHLLQWGAKQRCCNPGAFQRDIVELFKKECDIFRDKGIDLDKVMKEVLRISREHEVTVDSSYASLVIGVCVIVGFATSLDPEVNIMDAAAPCLLLHALTGGVMGRLYS
ncbi:hypothetical protein CEUSTIGMA_g3193.t1 [Chlamydomonas eustigma]|uniref:ABC1 atypical kinase-like domain-containing protein n=1 Tax=Chlamydomonas eustigma TaxID=1157962 RepID=A0A250WZ19_9CHLO|nr:hypothetical protein CEUSTIGMA_g3193.t1 [Chlamydomonas eustigma]|eukprot:GAX75750.1 hypothetical protein CEUSTIGMA_g3193.t1 [Chlamydomonas eustigma]